MNPAPETLKSILWRLLAELERRVEPDTQDTPKNG
jgi:hypothetical protein